MIIPPRQYPRGGNYSWVAFVSSAMLLCSLLVSYSCYYTCNIDTVAALAAGLVFLLLSIRITQAFGVLCSEFDSIR